MRDPDLVQRAERAAAALEQAWVHWRIRHGLGPGPLPPVSSYVGYSVTEPWGQPRVVLGVEAHEAERLAAILEGHDCVGPVHGELAAGLPDRRQPADVPARAQPAAAESPAEQSSFARPAAAQAQAAPPAVVPAQAEPRPAEPAFGYAMLAAPAPAHARPEPDELLARPLPGTGPAAADPAQTMPDDLTAEQPILPRALRHAAAMADTPAELPDHDAAYLRELAARSAGRPPMARAFPAAPVLPPAGQSAPEPADGPQPGIVALRPRSAPPSGVHVGSPLEVGLHAEQWQSQAPGDPAESGEPQARQPGGRARLLPVSRLSRSRRQAAGGGQAGPWPSAGDGKRAATDTAV
jgi:hypothetical protein